MTAVITRVLVTALLLLTCPLALLAQPRPGAFTTLTASTSVTSPSVVVTGSGAAALDVTGGINAGSGNVGIVGTDGRIPAISSTYFANLSGTNITDVVIATAATSISGVWTLNNNVSFQSRNNLNAVVNVAVVTSANTLIFGPTDAQVAGGVGVNTAVTATGTVNFATNQVSRTTIDSTGALTHGYALALTGAISPAALASGSTNNYNPTSLASSSYVILTADAGGSTLTGLTAQPSGTEITLCEPVPGASSLTIAHESGSSTAANRFNNGAQANITLNKDTSSGVGGPCVTYWYYGAGARWLLKSTSGSVP